MAIAWFTGFEFGSAEGLTLGVTGVELFSASAGTLGTNVAIDPAVKRTGGYSLKIANGGAATHASLTLSEILGAAPSVLVGRTYIYFPTLPSADVSVLMHVVGASGCSLRYRNSGTRLGFAFDGATEQFTEAIQAQTWYRIDYRIDVSTGSWTADWQVDGSPQTQATASSSPATVTTVRYGGTSTVAHTVHHDDVALSTTSGDYPLGPGEVHALKVDGIGTHSQGNGAFRQSTNNGGALAALDGTEWQKIDDVPAIIGASADLVCQTENDTSGYVEFTHADTSLATVRAVRVLARGWAATGTAASLGIRMFANSVEQEIIPQQDYFFDASTTTAWVAKVVPTADGSTLWTPTLVNGARTRVGFSGDAAPDVGIHNIILEVEGTAAGGGAAHERAIMSRVPGVLVTV